MRRPSLVAMDLEGVLVPEIWIGVARLTGIRELERTTRDEPDYDELMRGRLAILDREGIRIDTIREAIGQLEPLPGAAEYVAWVRERAQLILLSDTYYQFAGPLMRALDWPTLFCNHLELDADGRIIGYRLRIDQQKRSSVEALRALGFRVLAVGDSYNDTRMLAAADRGLLFRPAEAVAREFPQYPVVREFPGMRAAVEEFLDGGIGY